ncbi:MAG: mandelate racemase/muconate lactonizing enzyme family protein [Sphaerochaetaceae bacterium]
MKISNVRVFRLNLPTDVWMLVSIETDIGLTGWAEITDSFNDDSLAHTVLEAKQSLIGKNPLHINECLAPFTRWTYPSREIIRYYRVVLSGIDQALWDLNAKFYDVPLYKLYGADGSTSVPLYANLNKAIRNKRDADTLKTQGELARASGFKMVKCTPFDEVSPCMSHTLLEKGFERFAALAEVVPVENIAIDCHQRFERHSLTQMADKILKDFGIPYWIEDPVEISDFTTMAIMQSRFPQVLWAAGEDSLTIKQIHKIVVSESYDILMPDVKYIGGPSTVKPIIQYAESTGFRVSLHNPNGIIATAHSAHLSALSRNDIPMEFPFKAVEDRNTLSVPKENIIDGTYVFNDSPGIGVDITKEVLKEFAFEYCENSWIHL